MIGLCAEQAQNKRMRDANAHLPPVVRHERLHQLVGAGEGVGQHERLQAERGVLDLTHGRAHRPQHRKRDRRAATTTATTTDAAFTAVVRRRQQLFQNPIGSVAC